MIGAPTGFVSFVDLRTGRSRPGVGGHTGFIAQDVYSPNGRVAVTTGQDAKVIVWDPSTALPIEVLSGHAGPVHGVAFSADGDTLYTCSLDGVVLAWDLGSSRRFGQPFTAKPGLAAAGLPGLSPGTPNTPPLASSPDGSQFAVRVGTSTVGLFSTRTLREERSFATPSSDGILTALAWSPNGSELAVGGHSATVELWSLSGTPHMLRTLSGLEARNGDIQAIQAVGFSSPGGRLVSASDLEQARGPVPPRGQVAIWRTATGKLVAPPVNLGSPGDSVAFSSSGKLAVGLNRGPVWVLDPTTGRVIRALHPIGSADGFGAASVAFAPDGTLATGSLAGIVQLWNPATGRGLAHPVLVAAAPVGSISFDQSGQRFLTTGGGDGTTKLWFTATLQQVGSDLHADPGHWGNAAFAPDGKTLLVIYDDGTGFRWPATVNAWEEHACAVAGRNLTGEEWARFVTGYSYSPVCPRETASSNAGRGP
jgi:WD40 repeat protein